MNHMIIVAVVLLGILFALGIGFGLYRYKKHMDKKSQDLIVVAKHENVTASTRWRHALYLFLNDFVLVKHYFGQIRKRYEILEPGQQKKIEDDSLNTFLAILGSSMVIIIISLCISVSFYMAICGGVLVYVVSSTIIRSSVNKKEILLLSQLKEFLSEVRHNYYSSQEVDTSIYESLINTEEPIKSHMSTIYEILNSKNIEEDMAAYRDNAPNRYIELFLGNCVQIVKYSDKQVGEQSVFLKNLSQLEADIEEELLKRRDLDHKMAGLTYISIVPMYFLKIIERWALNNLENLNKYYTGSYGIIASVIICLGSLIIYTLLEQMMDSEGKVSNEHIVLQWISERPFIRKIVRGKLDSNYGKTLKIKKMLHRLGDSITVEQLLVKRVIFSLVAFVIGLCITGVVHINITNEILTDTSSFEELTMMIPDNEQLLKLEAYVLDTAKTMRKDSNINFDGVKEFVESQNVFSNDVYINAAAKEIYSRIEKVRNNYFRWWELIIVLVLSVVAYRFPLMLIYFRKKMLEQKMENEVILYQSIILMMMYHERVTTKDILENMETFAYIFKRSISECIDRFPAGELDALKYLKEEEPYPPLQKIIDNLIIADRIGVRMAFDEVEKERKTFQEKRKQDNRFETERKGALGSFIAFIPLAVVVVLYIIVPFIIEGLGQFKTFGDAMNSMM